MLVWRSSDTLISLNIHEIFFYMVEFSLWKWLFFSLDAQNIYNKYEKIKKIGEFLLIVRTIFKSSMLLVSFFCLINRVLD